MFSTPAVADDRLFIGSCAGRFMALDPRDGKPIWEYNIHSDGEQTSFHGDALVAENLILIASDNTFNNKGIGHIYAFDRSTGRVVWKYRDAFGISTDVVRCGPRVYAVTLADELLCLDLKTGKMRWEHASGAKNDALRQPMSPAVHGELVYFGTLDGHVHAFDAKSGERRWTRNLGDRISMTPLVWSGRLYVGTHDGHVFSLDLRSGKTIAKLKLPGGPSSPPACDGQRLFVGLGRSQVAAIPPDLDQVQWTYSSPDRITVSRPHLIEGQLLIGTSEGKLVALEASTGKVVWQHVFEGEVIRSIGTWKDMLFVGTQRGMLYACSLPTTVQSG